MLIEFSVENFRSIKERVTLSMIAASKRDELQDNLIQTNFKDMDLLKSAVIYGPNASGKSNIIRALWTMRGIIRKSNKIQKGEELPLVPFMFDMKSQTQPSSFEVLFIQDGIRYIYGFSADSRKIYDEYLYYFPSGKKSIIFERTETTDFKFTKDVREQKELAGRTLANALYLSTATQWNYEKTSKAFDWFKNLKFINASSSNKSFTANLLTKDKNAKEYVRELLRGADTGIQDINIKIKEISLEDLPEDFPESLRDIFLKDGKGKVIDAKTVHYINGREDSPVNLDIYDESDGTQKFFYLSGPLYDVLKNGKILFVDELSVRLHPYLVESLVKRFNSEKYNPNGAQLIFTTHNTYLLKQSLFRRDQIWFTEKTPEESTDLYSLYEIKGIRKEENIEKGYLLGRYGAIPFIEFGR